MAVAAATSHSVVTAAASTALPVRLQPNSLTVHQAAEAHRLQVAPVTQEVQVQVSARVAPPHKTSPVAAAVAGMAAVRVITVPVVVVVQVTQVA